MSLAATDLILRYCVDPSYVWGIPFVAVVYIIVLVYKRRNYLMKISVLFAITFVLFKDPYVINNCIYKVLFQNRHSDINEV
jgi:hypothetical protein